MLYLLKMFLFKIGLIECVHEYNKWENSTILQYRHCKKCNIKRIR